jgi:hypothetical protein
MKIRSANHNHAELIRMLLSELGYPEQDSHKFNQTFIESLQNQSLFLKVAEDEIREIVGYILYSTKPQLRLCGHSIEIDELSVSKKCAIQAWAPAFLMKRRTMQWKWVRRELSFLPIVIERATKEAFIKNTVLTKKTQLG